MTDIIAALRARGADVRENEPMSAHTSFKIGGPARLFVQSEADILPEIARAARKLNLPLLLIGNGSNLLVSDKGINGVVARITPGVSVIYGQTLSVSAGTSLASIAVNAAQAGLSGLEFAHGIPGSVGGAVCMNAGAYGGQISDVLQSCTCVDLSGDELAVFDFSNEQMCFGYRESALKHSPHLALVSAQFELERGDKAQIEQKMRELAAARREKQPLEYPGAGSVYKRPEGHFAGKLIEDCGLKGVAVGGAQVSEKHAGFIINRGGATCADVLALMEHIEREVLARFGVRLEREVRTIGEL